MNTALFSLEPLDGCAFEGATDGTRWNGWACPYFTKAQAERIVAAWEARGYRADYDPASDAFRFAPIDKFGKPDPDLGDEEDAERFPAVVRDGLHLYAVGAHAWVWEEASAPEPVPA